jgi:hypothetical protein
MDAAPHNLGLLALLDEALGTTATPGLTPYDDGGGGGVDGGPTDDNAPPAARSTASRARPRSSRRSLSRASRLLSPRGSLRAPVDAAAGVPHPHPPPAAAARVEARLQAYERQWAAFRGAQAAAQGRLPGSLVVARADGWRDTQAVRDGVGAALVRRIGCGRGVSECPASAAGLTTHTHTMLPRPTPHSPPQKRELLGLLAEHAPDVTVATETWAAGLRATAGSTLMASRQRDGAATAATTSTARGGFGGPASLSATRYVRIGGEASPLWAPLPDTAAKRGRLFAGMSLGEMRALRRTLLRQLGWNDGGSSEGGGGAGADAVAVGDADAADPSDTHTRPLGAAAAGFPSLAHSYREGAAAAAGGGADAAAPSSNDCDVLRPLLADEYAAAAAATRARRRQSSAATTTARTHLRESDGAALGTQTLGAGSDVGDHYYTDDCEHTGLLKSPLPAAADSHAVAVVTDAATSRALQRALASCSQLQPSSQQLPSLPGAHAHVQVVADATTVAGAAVGAAWADGVLLPPQSQAVAVADGGNGAGEDAGDVICVGLRVTLRAGDDAGASSSVSGGCGSTATLRVANTGKLLLCYALRPQQQGGAVGAGGCDSGSAFTAEAGAGLVLPGGVADVTLAFAASARGDGCGGDVTVGGDAPLPVVVRETWRLTTLPPLACLCSSGSGDSSGGVPVAVTGLRAPRPRRTMSTAAPFDSPPAVPDADARVEQAAADADAAAALQAAVDAVAAAQAAAASDEAGDEAARARTFARLNPGLTYRRPDWDALAALSAQSAAAAGAATPPLPLPHADWGGSVRRLQAMVSGVGALASAAPSLPTVPPEPECAPQPAAGIADAALPRDWLAVADAIIARVVVEAGVPVVPTALPPRPSQPQLHPQPPSRFSLLDVDVRGRVVLLDTDADALPAPLLAEAAAAAASAAGTPLGDAAAPSPAASPPPPLQAVLSAPQVQRALPSLQLTLARGAAAVVLPVYVGRSSDGDGAYAGLAAALSSARVGRRQATHPVALLAAGGGDSDRGDGSPVPVYCDGRRAVSSVDGGGAPTPLAAAVAACIGSSFPASLADDVRALATACWSVGVPVPIVVATVPLSAVPGVPASPLPALAALGVPPLLRGRLPQLACWAPWEVAAWLQQGVGRRAPPALLVYAAETAGGNDSAACGSGSYWDGYARHAGEAGVDGAALAAAAAAAATAADNDVSARAPLTALLAALRLAPSAQPVHARVLLDALAALHLAAAEEVAIQAPLAQTPSPHESPGTQGGAVSCSIDSAASRAPIAALQPMTAVWRAAYTRAARDAAALAALGAAADVIVDDSSGAVGLPPGVVPRRPRLLLARARAVAVSVAAACAGPPPSSQRLPTVATLEERTAVAAATIQSAARAWRARRHVAAVRAARAAELAQLAADSTAVAGLGGALLVPPDRWARTTRTGLEAFGLPRSARRMPPVEAPGRHHWARRTCTRARLPAVCATVAGLSLAGAGAGAAAAALWARRGRGSGSGGCCDGGRGRLIAVVGGGGGSTPGSLAAATARLAAYVRDGPNAVVLTGLLGAAWAAHVTLPAAYRGPPPPPQPQEAAAAAAAAVVPAPPLPPSSQAAAPAGLGKKAAAAATGQPQKRGGGGGGGGAAGSMVQQAAPVPPPAAPPPPSQPLPPPPPIDELAASTAGVAAAVRAVLGRVGDGVPPREWAAVGDVLRGIAAAASTAGVTVVAPCDWVMAAAPLDGGTSLPPPRTCVSSLDAPLQPCDGGAAPVDIGPASVAAAVAAIRDEAATAAAAPTSDGAAAAAPAVTIVVHGPAGAVPAPGGAAGCDDAGTVALLAAVAGAGRGGGGDAGGTRAGLWYRDSI